MLVRAGGIVLSLAHTLAELQEAKVIDDLAFGGHHGITLEELEAIAGGLGFVALLRQEGVLVGESQVLLHQIADMRWRLPEDSAFCYGIATHPDFQGRGFGKQLLLAQDEIAGSRGAMCVFTTIRVENYASLKLFVDTGYRVVRCIPFYGSSIEERRLLLRRDLNVEAVTQLDGAVFAKIRFGDEVDSDAHEQIVALLDGGLVGVSVSRAGILFART